jgi:EpsI family protein
MKIGSEVVVEKKNLDMLPYTITEMKGTDVPMKTEIISELDTDVYIFRNYLAKDGKVINVYIGYYGTQKGGRSRHSPEGCYPGSGWSIVQENEEHLPVGKEDILLNVIQVKKGDEKELVYHWYQTQKKIVINNGIQQNFYRLKNRLLFNRDDGAFIRVSCDIGDDFNGAKGRIENFIRQLYPCLIEYWPQEKDIK